MDKPQQSDNAAHRYRVSGRAAKRPQPSAKAEAILAGAMQEFLAHGYSATSMDRVAKAAGVSKATVYSYFENKEKLFSASIERLAKEKYATVFNPTGDNDFGVSAQSNATHRSLQGEPPVALRRIINNFLEMAAGDPQLQDFMRSMMGESGRFPILAQVYIRHIAKPVLETIAGYLASHPNLQIADPEATARIILGTVVYFIILQEVMHGKEILPMERDRLVNSLVDLITVQSKIS